MIVDGTVSTIVTGRPGKDVVQTQATIAVIGSALISVRAVLGRTVTITFVTRITNSTRVAVAARGGIVVIETLEGVGVTVVIRARIVVIAD